MAFTEVATGSLVTVQNVFLQFSGDLIGLAILFLVLALVSGLLGATGVAGLSMDIAKWLVIIFVVLAVVSFLF